MYKCIYLVADRLCLVFDPRSGHTKDSKNGAHCLHAWCSILVFLGVGNG